MSGDEFISLASNLSVNPRLGTSEARFRSAVSRAYYGAYHLALDMFAELNVRIPRNHSGHYEIYRLLSSIDQPTSRLLAGLLSDLRRARNSADYDFDNSMFKTQSIATWSVESANELRQALGACRQEPLRGMLLSAVAGRTQE